jgi:hypothetical protein
VSLWNRLFRRGEASAPAAQREDRPSAREDSHLLAQVDTAVEVLRAHPREDQGTVLLAIESRGIAPRDCWRLYQFVPMAFAHVVFGRAGVHFAPDYISLDPETQVRVQRPLAGEPLYRTAVQRAEGQVGAGATDRDLLPVFRLSAEYSVIDKLLQGGGNLSDLGLVEPILFEYTE